MSVPKGSPLLWAVLLALILAPAVGHAADNVLQGAAAPASPGVAVSGPAGGTTAPAPPAAPAGTSQGEIGTASPKTVWNVDAVVAIALANHPLVRRSDAEVGAAAARKGQAASPYYPTVDLSAGYSRFRRYVPSSDQSVTESLGSVQGSVSQVIADFGRRRNNVDSTSSLLSAARETGRGVRQDVALDAKIAFFDVLRARSLMDVAREALDQRGSLLHQAEAYYEAGIRARIDVARAEANLYQARAELTTIENNLRVSRATLLNRMGIDGPADFDLAYALPIEPVAGTVPEWIAEAERNLPDLQALLAQEKAAGAALRAARAGNNPLLTGAGSYGYASDDFPLQETYSVGVLLSVPVFTGYLVREQAAEAEANLAAVRHSVADLRARVRLAVEQAASRIASSSERIEARKKEKDSSDENLRLAAGRYEVGAGDIIEMIDAQVQKSRSDATLIEAYYDFAVANAELLRAIGR